MTSGYFEDIEVGDSRKAGPYFVSKAEIIKFAKQYDPRPFHITVGIRCPHVRDLHLAK
jgi:hypothetical protein